LGETSGSSLFARTEYTVGDEGKRECEGNITRGADRCSIGNAWNSYAFVDSPRSVAASRWRVVSCAAPTRARTASRMLSPFRGFLVLVSALVSASSVSAAALGNGLKIGEVTSTSAIVWTRLTSTAEPNRNGVPFAPDADAIP